MFICGGLIVLGFTAFFEPIAFEFGWTYAQVSLAIAFRGVEVGLAAPLLGPIVDRHGPRPLMIIGLLIAGAGLLILSQCKSLGMFYGSFAVVAIGMSGISPTVVFTAVAQWFRKKVGLATGITASGFASGGLLVPLVVELIDVFDWRLSLVILAIFIWITCIPLATLVRHKPEQYGYVPDGEPVRIPSSEKSNFVVKNDSSISVRKAIKSRAFWQIGIAMPLVWFSTSAMTLHVMPYLNNIGIGRTTASLVAMIIPVISIAGRLSSGWLADKFNKIVMCSIFILSVCAGLLLFSYVTEIGTWILIIFALLFGIGWGGANITRTAILRDYFGRSNFGTIFGFSMGITAIGTILGPYAAGWIFDIYGSYRPVWLLYALFSFIAIILIYTMPKKNSIRQTV